MVQSLEGFGNIRIPEESVIDWEAVPRVYKDMILRAVANRMREFFEDPENVKGFEEWKKKREQHGTD